MLRRIFKVFTGFIIGIVEIKLTNFVPVYVKNDFFIKFSLIEISVIPFENGFFRDFVGLIEIF